MRRPPGPGSARKPCGWLKAELAAWERVALTAGPGNKQTVAASLMHWKADPDLASIRDEAELAKLPEAERVAFQKLWADVDALLVKVGRPRRGISHRGGVLLR